MIESVPAPLRPLTITSPRVLLVEGKDEENFFRALCGCLGMEQTQVLPVGGKYQFPSRFPAFLIAPGFDKVRAYAIVQDADVSVASTFRSIQGLLKRNEQPCPPRSGMFTRRSGRAGRRVGVFILPGNSEQGMLEDLCLATVDSHPAMPCVDKFMDCLEQVLPKKRPGPSAEGHKAYYPKNATKARALAFLAAMHDEVHRVGEAAQQRCWNFDHPCMAGLKQFLSALVET